MAFRQKQHKRHKGRIMDIKKAAPITDAANEHANNSTPCFKFCSGNSGAIQRKIIRHLLAMIDGGFDNCEPLKRLEISGTDAIRALCAPHKNPMEYISQLRAINGKDCILSVPVKQASIGNGWQSPIYYFLPVVIRQAWREALQKPQHVASVSKAGVL